MGEAVPAISHSVCSVCKASLLKPGKTFECPRNLEFLSVDPLELCTFYFQCGKQVCDCSPRHKECGHVNHKTCLFFMALGAVRNPGRQAPRNIIDNFKVQCPICKTEASFLHLRQVVLHAAELNIAEEIIYTGQDVNTINLVEQITEGDLRELSFVRDKLSSTQALYLCFLKEVVTLRGQLRNAVSQNEASGEIEIEEVDLTLDERAKEPETSQAMKLRIVNLRHVLKHREMVFEAAQVMKNVLADENISPGITRLLNHNKDLSDKLIKAYAEEHQQHLEIVSLTTSQSKLTADFNNIEKLMESKNTEIRQLKQQNTEIKRLKKQNREIEQLRQQNRDMNTECLNALKENEKQNHEIQKLIQRIQELNIDCVNSRRESEKNKEETQRKTRELRAEKAETRKLREESRKHERKIECIKLAFKNSRQQNLQHLKTALENFQLTEEAMEASIHFQITEEPMETEER